MPSRLGEPVRKKGSGASVFATPVISPTDALPSKHKSIETSKQPSIAAAKEPPARKKIVTTVRLTPAACDRLDQLGIEARRAGLRGRQSSASDIMEALIMTGEMSAILSFLKDL